MNFKTVFLVLLVISCGFIGQVHGDDECVTADDTEQQTFGLRSHNENVDLTIETIGIILTDEDFQLTWSLRNESNCVVFHITVEDEELGVITDIQVEQNSTTLDPMSPCVSYRLSLRAINKSNSTLQGPLTTSTILFNPKAQDAPRLKTVSVQATSVNMIWALEGKKNRCPLSNLYLVGGNNDFNVTVPLENLTDPSVASVELTSLLPNTLYYFQVTVENSGGISPSTALGVQTLELSEI